MKIAFAAASVLVMISSIAADSALDMRTHELTYHYTASLEGNQMSARITCRPVKDTTIHEIAVIKYRFVKDEADSSDTSFEYLAITDTSVINYAWRGNIPMLLLKRASDDDTLFQRCWFGQSAEAPACCGWYVRKQFL